MAGSVWPALNQAIITLMRARSGFRDPSNADAGETDVPVFDGPELFTADDAAPAFVAFGLSDVDEITAGDADQNVAVLPVNATSRSRDETGTIVSVIRATSAEGVAAAARNEAFRIMAEIEAAIRVVDTPHLGVANTLWIQMGPYRVDQWASQNEGIVCGLTFTLTYRARI